MEVDVNAGKQKKADEQMAQELMEALENAIREPSTETDKIIYEYAKKWFKETARPNGTRGARIIPVIVTEALEGRGTEIDPLNIKRQYWTLDGKPIGVGRSEKEVSRAGANSEHVPKAEQANSCATSANCGRSIPEICGEMQSTLREHLKSETELHMLMHELLIALSKP